MMRALILMASAVAVMPAQADENCHFEPIALFKADKPKATMVKRPPLIGPAAQKVKPKAKRVKRLAGPRKDGYDWMCDDEPIDPTPFERVALLPPVPTASPQAPEAAMPGAPIFGDGTPDGAAFNLPTEPPGAGQAGVEAAPVFFAWPAPSLVAYGPVLYLPVAAVAEPESYALLIVGLMAVAACRWGRK